jgi:hypothetical protein
MNDEKNAERYRNEESRTEQSKTGHTWKMVSSLTAFLSLDARV